MRFVDVRAGNAHRRIETAKNVKKSRRFPVKLVILFLVAFFVLLSYNSIRRRGFSALLDPISIVTSVVGSSDLLETDGRTNLLILGLDTRLGQVDSPTLTDTIIVASLGHAKNDVLMISLPRDLWVKSSSGNYSKLNAVYELSGISDSVKVVEEILGVPVHYYAVVDFVAFTKMIEVLGGIDVDVETTFDDYYYPVEGMENAEDLNQRYTHVHFDKGLQKMDATTALIFSRSRKGDNGEGTDFARAKRQQKVILAIRNKALSFETLANPIKLKELYDTYKEYVQTNVGLSEIEALYQAGEKIETESIRAIVLDDRSEEAQGGLLHAPEDTTLYGGSYVLIPKVGNYSQIHAYISKFLFGE